MSHKLGRILWRDYRVAPVFVLIVGLAALSSPHFRQRGNAANIVKQMATRGVVAVGMTFVISGGGIDLSVGSTVALTSVVVAQASGGGPCVQILVALALGAAVGAVNGLAIAVGRVTPFIATLATMVAARGAALRLCHGTPIYLGESGLTRFGEGWGLPAVFFVCVVVGAVVLTHTRFGRCVLAVGSSREAAWASGIGVSFYTFAVYVLCGMGAGLAGLLDTCRNATGSPKFGELYELDAIAAVVIGGTSILGGRGTVLGTCLAVLILGIVNNVFNLLDLPPYDHYIAKGVIIMAAVLLQRSRKGR